MPFGPDEVGQEFADLHLHVERREQSAIIQVAGDVTVHNADTFAETLKNCLDETSVNKLVLALAENSYMDSSGLRVIAETYRRAAGLETDMEIHNPSETLGKILKVTGLAEYIPIIITDDSGPVGTPEV